MSHAGASSTSEQRRPCSSVQNSRLFETRKKEPKHELKLFLLKVTLFSGAILAILSPLLRQDGALQVHCVEGFCYFGEAFIKSVNPLDQTSNEV